MDKKILTAMAALAMAAGLCAQTPLQRGLAAESKGLTELAEDYYRQSADSVAEARLRLGLLLERRERYAEAARWLAAADTTALSLSHLSLCLAEQRDFQTARTVAQRAVEIATDDEKAEQAVAMGTLALVACDEGNYVGANQWAKRADAADRGSARVQNIVGIIYFRQGNDNEAIRSFREALRREADNVDATFNLGSVYCYRNNYDLAISTLKKGLKQHRNSIKLLYCLGWAFELKGETQGAVECLQNVIALDSSYVNAYNRLGDIYFDQGQMNQAIEQYRKAIAHAPKLTEAYRLLGRTYAEMKQYAKALTQYQKAVALDSSDSETYCAIAELYGRQNQPAKQKANYKRAAKLGNTKAQAWCTSNGVTYQ